MDAADWARKVYEVELTRMRPSGTEDTYILQYDGRAAGSKEMLERITEGAEIFCGGEIRSENVHQSAASTINSGVAVISPTIPIVLFLLIFPLSPFMIAVNDPPVEDQNEVTICGNICKPPSGRETKRRTRKGRRVTVTRLVVAVNTPTGAYYVPCVCWNEQAEKADDLKVGDYRHFVLILYGWIVHGDHFCENEHFHAVFFRFRIVYVLKKRIQGRKLPYLSTSYEVSVVRLEAERRSFLRK